MAKIQQLEGRLPPQNLEAEQSVLGSLMLDKDAIIKVADIIKPDDFYKPTHQHIFQSMVELYEKNEPIDLLSLTSRLQDKKQLEDIGGQSYLTDLVNQVPTASNIVHYAKIVKNKKILRDLISSSHQIIDLSYQEPEDADALLDLAEQKVFSVSQQSTNQKAVHIKEGLVEAFERIDRIHRGDEVTRGVPSGFIDLDNLLSGFQRSDLIVIAARPSLGKCLTADSEIIDPQTGEIKTIQDFVADKKSHILSLNNNYKIAKVKIGDYIDDGKKPAYRVKTALGKAIKTTLTHPFLTIDGWKRLKDIDVGQRIAIPRTIPVFGKKHMPAYQIKALAYFIADGGLTSRCPIFTNSNNRIVADFKKAIAGFPNACVKKATHDDLRTPSYRVSTLRVKNKNLIVRLANKLRSILELEGMSQRQLAIEANLSASMISLVLKGECLPTPANAHRIINVLENKSHFIPAREFDKLRNTNAVTKWLSDLNLMGVSALDKQIPNIVFSLSKKEISLFLNRLFACDGSIFISNVKSKTKTPSCHLSYSSSSNKLIKQVQHLLLRFGIISKIRKKRIKYKNKINIAYELEVHNAQNLNKFIKEIGVYGKEKNVQKVLKRIQNIGQGWTQDTLPIEVWSIINKIRGKKTWRSLYKKMGLPISHNIHANTRHPRRETVQKIAKALKSKELARISNSDIYWDRITEITYLGKKQVYDLTIPKHHNFIANDFFVHNTSLVMDFARHAALTEKIPVAFFSIEMSKEQLVDRLISSQAGVDSWRMRTGKLSGEGPDNDFDRIQRALDELSTTPIFLDDTPSPSVMHMRTMARRLQAEHNIGLVIIDYLQLIQPRNPNDSPVQQISEISRHLKALARELSVPVIAISQLSRAVESRTPAIPRLSDLRDSGAIEQDSDVVIFIYREDKDKMQSERKNIADIIVAKHRNGPTGSVELYFNESQTSFKNLERHFEE